MNKQRYIALLQDPSAVTKADIPDIEELISQFPYCQNAHILLAKIQHESGSMHAAKLTRKAALYTSDRTKLKRLLASPLPAKVGILEEKSVPAEEKTTSILKEEITSVAETTAIKIPTAIDEANAIPNKEFVQDISRDINYTPQVETPVLSNIKHEADKHAANFLTELEENLKALHESKLRAANLFKEDSKKSINNVESNVVKVSDKTEPVNVAAEISPVVESLVPEAKILADETPRVDNTPIEIENNLPIEDDFFSTLEDNTKTGGDVKKPYSALIEAEVPKTDPPKGNDVLDLILSFDNRVKDYFDINEYTTKNKSDISVGNSVNHDAKTQEVKPVLDTISYQIPFSNSDWKLEESRLEEQGHHSSSLLLNYLEFIRDQKNKKQQPDKKREKSIISRFIEKDPMISPLTYSATHSDEDNNELASNQGKPAFVSENFAKLLEKQGKFQKAIAVYEELILKNPEKNSYFASLIQELKKKL